MIFQAKQNAQRRLTIQWCSLEEQIEECQKEIARLESLQDQVTDDRDKWDKCPFCHSEDICGMDQVLWCENCYAEEVPSGSGFPSNADWSITDWTISMRVKNAMEVLNES